VHRRMSAYGTKRTFQSQRSMSAFGGKADILREAILASACVNYFTTVNLGT
jgi:hypothetical protein